MNAEDLSEEDWMISCIGVDNKQHACLPQSNTTKCGVQVKRKKLLKHDHELLSCYECTY